MPLQVFTCRRDTRAARDPDVFSVTRDGPESGHPFAPSWAILQPFLDQRQAQRSAFAGRSEEERAVARKLARDLEAAAWSDYVPAFLAEMRRSYVRERGAWEALLARERVVLACACQAPERCHRTILARRILPRLGAEYCGERVSTRAGIHLELVEVAS